MTTMVDFSFSKSFRLSSIPGITFHWIKSIFQHNKDDVIVNAVQLVYYPCVLASSPDLWEEVSLEVTRSRLIFKRKMALSIGTPSPALPKCLPKRVEISFSKNFTADSREGKTFDWLIQTYEERAIEALILAVRLLHYPAALSASIATRERAQEELKNSEIIFEELMIEALLKIKPYQELPLLLESPEISQKSSPSLAVETADQGAEELADDFAGINYDSESF